MQKEIIVEDRWRPNMKPMPPRRRSRIYISIALAIAGLTISLTSLTQASTVNVVNGGFEMVTPTLTLSTQFGALCCTPRPTNPLGPGAVIATVNGWSATGVTILYLPRAGTTSGTTADLTGTGGGAVTQFCSTATSSCSNTNRFRLWGPGTGSANGLTVSPVGGNFIALDGDPSLGNNPGSQGQIFQTIHGLDPGHLYHVSFFWAGAQQSGFNGANMEQLRVSLCAPGQSPGSSVPFQPPGASAPCSEYTSVIHNLTHGFTGWKDQTFTFKATGPNEVLDFLALGMPEGLPPVVLLDGVDVKPVPEPATWLLLGIGFAAIAVVAHRRPKWVSVA